jgi:putative methionine-R-sulfoxide reductase with GAF domain
MIAPVMHSDSATPDGAGSPLATDPAALDPQQPATADDFATLAIELHDSDGVEETIEAVVQFALQALNCSYAGVALTTRGQRPEIPAVTDPMVAEVYQLQMTSGSGPLVTAMKDRATVLIRDTTTDDRWPHWAAKVAALGVRSVLDVPLGTGAGSSTVGVLGLYSREPDAFSTDDEAVAHILARHASVAVAAARQEASLAEAVDARKLIGQAMGILMERFDLDSDQAFAVLKRYSQDHNLKLRVVAQHLIDTRKLPTRKTAVALNSAVLTTDPGTAAEPEGAADLATPGTSLSSDA